MSDPCGYNNKCIYALRYWSIRYLQTVKIRTLKRTRRRGRYTIKTKYSHAFKDTIWPRSAVGREARFAAHSIINVATAILGTFTTAFVTDNIWLFVGEVAMQQHRHHAQHQQQLSPGVTSAQHKVALSRNHSPTSRESKSANDT